jgi:hypothetical protein
MIVITKNGLMTTVMTGGLFKQAHIDYYFIYGGDLDDMDWRTFSPGKVFGRVSKLVTKRLG